MLIMDHSSRVHAQGLHTNLNVFLTSVYTIRVVGVDILNNVPMIFKLYLLILKHRYVIQF